MALTVGLVLMAGTAWADVPQSNLATAVVPIIVDSSVTPLTLPVEALQTETTTGGVTSITLSADVLFEFGQSTLTPAATGKVAQLAARLGTARGAVTVVGHTDSVGTPAANLALSLARAQTVRAALLKGLSNRAVQVVASGRGELAPVAPNTTGGKDNPEGRAKNRRVVISFR